MQYLRKDGVKITCMCPGHINTTLFDGFSSGPGSSLLTLDAQYVAEATVNAIENGEELVLLPRSFALIPAIKGTYETVTGRLGLPAMRSVNPMASWSPQQAQAAFAQMQGREGPQLSRL
jgi:short-subunit dehydrogenase